MQETLDVVLIITALTALAVDVVVLVCVILLVRFLKTLLNQPPQTYLVTSTGTTTGNSLNLNFTPAPAVKVAAPKPGFKCEHCGALVTGQPVRGIGGDEGNFLVYVCPNCKQETATPEDG